MKLLIQTNIHMTIGKDLQLEIVHMSRLHCPILKYILFAADIVRVATCKTVFDRLAQIKFLQLSI